LISAERIGAFLDCETTIVVEDVSISTGAVLSIYDDMRLDIVSNSFVTTKRIESSGIASYISRSWVHLMCWRVANRETAIVVRDILIAIVAALSESSLESITLVDEDGFKVA